MFGRVDPERAGRGGVGLRVGTGSGHGGSWRRFGSTGSPDDRRTERGQSRSARARRSSASASPFGSCRPGNIGWSNRGSAIRPQPPAAADLVVSPQARLRVQLVVGPALVLVPRRALGERDRHVRPEPPAEVARQRLARSGRASAGPSPRRTSPGRRTRCRRRGPCSRRCRRSGPARGTGRRSRRGSASRSSGSPSRPASASTATPSGPVPARAAGVQFSRPPNRPWIFSSSRRMVGSVSVCSVCRTMPGPLAGRGTSGTGSSATRCWRRWSARWPGAATGRSGRRAGSGT